MTTKVYYAGPIQRRFHRYSPHTIPCHAFVPVLLSLVLHRSSNRWFYTESAGFRGRMTHVLLRVEESRFGKPWSPSSLFARLFDYSFVSLSRWTRNLEETCSVTASLYTRPFYILSSTHENCQTGRIFPSARNVVAEAIKTGHPGVIRLRHVRTIERASAVRNSAQETASSTIKLIRYVVVSTRPYTGRLATKPLKPARAVRPA